MRSLHPSSLQSAVGAEKPEMEGASMGNEGNEHSDSTVNASLEGITLRVKNLEQSLEFYKKIPGARVIMQRPGHVPFALIQIGKGRLGLLQQGTPGAFHIEFDVADLDALYQQLQTAGVEAEEPPTRKGWGEYDFNVRDPDGNQIEFGSTRHDQPAEQGWVRES